MNPSDAHKRNHQVTRAYRRDGPATTYTSRHLLPPSRLVAPAFVHDDQQARTAQGVQFHAQSVGTEVSQNRACSRRTSHESAVTPKSPATADIPPPRAVARFYPRAISRPTRPQFTVHGGYPSAQDVGQLVLHIRPACVPSAGFSKNNL